MKKKWLVGIGALALSLGTLSSAAFASSSPTTSSSPTIGEDCSKTYGKLDLSFVVDTTGSMGASITSVKNSIGTIVNTVSASAPDYRIAISEFKDQGDVYVHRGDTTFTNDMATITHAIGTLSASGGGDIPESVYSGLEGSISGTDVGAWRDEAQKAIILMGDAPPHDPETGTGYTATQVNNDAIAKGIKIYTVAVPVSGSSVAPDTKNYFTQIANGTGGKEFDAVSASDVSTTILDAITTLVCKPVAQTTQLSMSDFTGDYNDATNVSATLKGQDGTPIANQPVTFTLNGQETAQGMTDSNGVATVSLTPKEAAGAYTLTASYAGDASDLASNASSTFTVLKEETTLDITSSSTLATGNVQVQAILKEDGQTALSGKSVTFTVGSQTATGTTDANGVVTATVNLKPDQYTVIANFNGDDYYKQSQSTSQILYVYQPTNFVIWGGNKANLADINAGQVYTFWGAKWVDQVTAGDFAANPSFKGYADQSNGSQWTTSPGNSSNPPASIANYIGVIITTSTTKTGNVESGNVAELVILKVDNPSSYQPNPGHPASGTMMSVIK